MLKTNMNLIRLLAMVAEMVVVVAMAMVAMKEREREREKIKKEEGVGLNTVTMPRLVVMAVDVV